MSYLFGGSVGIGLALSQIQCKGGLWSIPVTAARVIVGGKERARKEGKSMWAGYNIARTGG